MGTRNDMELAQAADYEVRPDPDQPGRFLWRNGGDGSDVSYDTEVDAWADAAFHAASDVMGHGNLSSEEWEAGSHGEHVEMARAMTGKTPSLG